MTFAAGQALTQLISQLRHLPRFDHLPSPAPINWVMSGTSVAILIAAGIYYLRSRSATANHPSVALRAARRHRGQYLTPHQLDTPARHLLHRTQQAIDAITASAIYRDGLLDSIRHGVVLGDREWEIATMLHTHTKLRTQLTSTPDLTDPRVRALVARYRWALQTSLQSLTVQVEWLEDYARQIRQADADYKARRTAAALTAWEDRYREILARTVTTPLAVAEITQLAEQTRDLMWESCGSGSMLGRQSGSPTSPGATSSNPSEWR